MRVQKIKSYLKIYKHLKPEMRIEKALEDFDRDEHRQMEAIRVHWESYHVNDFEHNASKACESAEEYILRTEVTEQLQKAVLELNKVQRRRLVQYFYYGFTQKQIADLEGVCQSTVQRSILKSLEKIKNYIKFWELDA